MIFTGDRSDQNGGVEGEADRGGGEGNTASWAYPRVDRGRGGYGEGSLRDHRGCGIEIREFGGGSERAPALFNVGKLHRYDSDVEEL